MADSQFVVFLPCPSVIGSCLNPEDPLHASSQLFIKELHEERMLVKVSKNFKGIGTHSIRDALIDDIINEVFEKEYNKNKNLQEASLAVEPLALIHATLEESGKSEFKNPNKHTSILELAKDLSTDAKVSEIIIVCNCKDKQPLKDSKEGLIDERKKKNNGDADFLYEFELFNTKELFEKHTELLTKHN